jgi:nucleotide-binding universal stress UspA family protein
MIVIGTHERHGLAGHLAGSVTRDLISHTALPILVVRRRGTAAGHEAAPQ